MAYRTDINGDIIIDGFANGIGSDPYSGLTDLKSVNPISVANEASISFSTKSLYTAPELSNQTGTTQTTQNWLLVNQSILLETGQWVIFTSVGTSGLSLAVPYYLLYSGNGSGNNQYQLFTTTAAFPPSSSATVISANSSVTFSTINPGLVKYFTKSRGNDWMIDANGRVWGNIILTGTGGGPVTGSWSYLGNATDTTSNGNGIACYQTVTDGTGGLGTAAGVDEWIFIWRNSQIDYTKITANGSATGISWVNGWKPSSGTATNSQYLQNSASINSSHQALMAPDGRIYYCDANFVGKFYQNVPSPGSNYVGFNPLILATYTFSTTTLLPFNDNAQCLMFLNASLYVGGRLNIIYPWDTISATYSTPLTFLPESNISCLISTGNNGYVFAGNRGNIYRMNGSQADFLKKIPDHISGAVEPLIFWGGYGTNSVPTGTAVYNKNRLYFGCQVSLQAGGNAMGYGGIWCLDLNTNSLWNSNQMSYGSYAGYVTALNISSSQASYGSNIGYGLLAGWSDGGTPVYGIDACIAAPYTGTQSYVVSDVIPVGTIFKKMTPYQFEFKTAMPLQNNESISLYAGYSLVDYTSNTMQFLGTASGATLSTGVNAVLSANFPTTVQGQQWLILQAVLTAASGGTPTYNRLTQLRIIGDTIKTQVPGQPYGIQ